MKLDSILNGKGRDWCVSVKKTGKPVYFGDRTACVRFIAGFDRASDRYVDLRMYYKDGREFDYHALKFVDKE